MSKRVCHGCGAEVHRDDPVPRDATCEACGRDLRCCRNCRHWDERASGECRETEADLVPDKWRRNFCEYFAWSPGPFTADASAARAAAARAKLDALFGGTPGAPARPPAPGTRSKLDALFRDPGPKEEGDEPDAESPKVT